MIKLAFGVVRLFLIFDLIFQIYTPMPTFALVNTWSAVDRPSTPGGTIFAIQQSVSNPEIFYTLVDSIEGKRLFRSSDRSDHWNLVHQFDTETYDLAIDPENPDIVYVGAQDGLFRSVDGGLDWEIINLIGRPFALPASNTIYTVEEMDNPPESCQNIEYSFTWSFNGGVDWESSDLGCFSNVGSITASTSQPYLIYVVVGLLNDFPPRPF